jgi:hypothetical protein
MTENPLIPTVKIVVVANLYKDNSLVVAVGAPPVEWSGAEVRDFYARLKVAIDQEIEHVLELAFGASADV